MSVTAGCALIYNAAFGRLQLDQHALGRCGTIRIPNLYFYIDICERSRIRPNLRPGWKGNKKGNHCERQDAPPKMLHNRSCNRVSHFPKEAAFGKLNSIAK